MKSRALLRGDDTDVCRVGRKCRIERALVVVTLRRDDDRRGGSDSEVAEIERRAHELGMWMIRRVTTVVDHRDLPLECARLDRQRVHGGRPADDDQLRDREERFDVHLQRTFALARHGKRQRAVERTGIELVRRTEEQQP